MNSRRRLLRGTTMTAVVAAMSCVGSAGLLTASAGIDSGERSVYVPIVPCRVMDTRAGEQVGPRSTPIDVGETYTVSVVGTNGGCTIPTDAVGLGLNVTAVNPTAASFLTVFPAGGSRPLASNVNWVAGQPPTPNAVTVRVGASGQVSFYNHSGSVDLAADIVGYYVDHSHDDRYYTKAQIDSTFTALNAATLPITSAAILDGAVASVDIADGGVAGVDIGAATITGTNIAHTNSIVSDQVAPLNGDADILDNSITTFDIADNAIDSDEVLDFGLTNQDIGVLFAQVSAAGAIDGSSGAVTGSRIAAGSYEVDFGRNISTCAFVATQGEAGTGAATGAIMGVADRIANVEAVFVTVRSETNVLVDRAFQLIVVC